MVLCFILSLYWGLQLVNSQYFVDVNTCNTVLTIWIIQFAAFFILFEYRFFIVHSNKKLEIITVDAWHDEIHEKPVMRDRILTLIAYIFTMVNVLIAAIFVGEVIDLNNYKQ